MTTLPESADQIAIRRPRRPFARGDRTALGVGVLFAAAMIAWVSVRATQNLMKDRLVRERPAASLDMEHH